MVTRIKEEKYELNRSALGFGLVEDDISVVTGEGLQAIWRFQVPTGYSLIFGSEDTFSAYLETDAPAEAGASSLVAIEKADASQQAFQSLLNTVRYAQIKNFQDVDLLVHMDIKPGDSVIAEEGHWVIIKGNINAVLDASDSYFALTCKRVRKGLFT